MDKTQVKQTYEVFSNSLYTYYFRAFPNLV